MSSSSDAPEVCVFTGSQYAVKPNGWLGSSARPAAAMGTTTAIRPFADAHIGRPGDQGGFIG